MCHSTYGIVSEQHRHQLSMFEREQKVVEELDYDDCDITVNGNNKSLTIDEQMRKIGFQGIKSALVKASTLDEESPSEEDNNREANDDSLSSDQDNQLGSGSAEGTPATTEPTSPTAMTAASAASAAAALPVVEEDSSDYQMVMQLLEEGEKITHMYRCARIQGLDTFEGLLLFGREHFYLLDGFTLMNGREVHDIEFLPPGRYDPIIPQVPGQGPTGSKLLRQDHNCYTRQHFLSIILAFSQDLKINQRTTSVRKILIALNIIIKTKMIDLTQTL